MLQYVCMCSQWWWWKWNILWTFAHYCLQFIDEWHEKRQSFEEMLRMSKNVDFSSVSSFYSRSQALYLCLLLSDCEQCKNGWSITTSSLIVDACLYWKYFHFAHQRFYWHEAWHIKCIARTHTHTQTYTILNIPRTRLNSDVGSLSFRLIVCAAAFRNVFLVGVCNILILNLSRQAVWIAGRRCHELAQIKWVYHFTFAGLSYIESGRRYDLQQIAEPPAWKNDWRNNSRKRPCFRLKHEVLGRRHGISKCGWIFGVCEKEKRGSKAKRKKIYLL